MEPSFLKRLTLLFGGLLCLLAPPPVLAEPEIYTLPQAVAYALRHNGELNALREEQGLREAAKIQSTQYPNPVLELGGRSGSLTGSSSESNLSIGLSQEIITAGKKGKRSRLAVLDLEAYQFLLADRERLLTEVLATTFQDLLLAEKRLEFAGRFIGLNRNLLEVTRERLSAGDIPELELNLVRVELSRSEEKRIEMHRDLVSLRANLSTLMGLGPESSAAVSGSLETTPKPGKLEELSKTALKQRSDLKQLEHERTKGETEIELARSELIPNLTAGLSFERETTAGEAGRTEENYLIGLKLSIPIPLFDRNQAAMKTARTKKNASEQRYITARKNIEREVETAYTKLNSAEATVALYAKEILPQLEENLKLVQEAYRLGEIGILAVIEEQKKYFEVNDGYLAALHSRQTALVKLEAAVATDLSGGVQ
ncbi:MAG TPA: TolC family protein [Desulfuromonadaceae bacterium]